MKGGSALRPLPATVAQAIERCSELLAAGDLFFGHGTDNPWDEALHLVIGGLGLWSEDPKALPGRPVSEGEARTVEGLLRRRVDERTPLPYLLGEAWFAGLRFHCDQRALVPRSPLAELIRNDYLPWYGGPTPRRALDLCCGGGAIGIAAACYDSGLQVVLADLDRDALALAKANVRRHGLEERVRCVESDLFERLASEHFDLILSNPPYVDARDLKSMPAEYRHEPVLGLAAGGDGLALARRILAAAERHLNEEGLLLLEVGNSWAALEADYPTVPFTWVELQEGGHGVAAMTAGELHRHRTVLAYNSAG